MEDLLRTQCYDEQGCELPVSVGIPNSVPFEILTSCKVEDIEAKEVSILF